MVGKTAGVLRIAIGEAHRQRYRFAPVKGDAALLKCYSPAMPRLPSTVFTGLPHHVALRGNRREEIFFAGADRETYPSWLREYSDKHQVDVLAS